MVNDVLSGTSPDIRLLQGSGAASATDARQPASGKNVPPSGGAVPQPNAAPAIKPPDLSRVIQNLNAFLERNQRDLSFRVDEASGRTIITVVNPATGEIVRQIPPEEVLAVARSIRDLGVLLDARA